MKANQNTLYSTDDYVNGKLISDDTTLTVENSRKKQIKTEEIVKLLEEGTNDEYQHRCISVYRDGFIHNGDIYNICLSCGDYYKSSELHYLIPHITNELKILLDYKK